MSRVSAEGQGLTIGSGWRRAALLSALLATSCAHTPTLADIHTESYTLPSVDGAPLALRDLRGKVVIVSFFATWCFPCVAEVALFKHLQEQHPRDLAIVSIGMDLEGGIVLKPYRDAMQIAYPVLIADDDTRKGDSPFGPIHELPSTFVLDREGHVQSAFSGVASEAVLEQMVDQLAK